MHAPQLKHITRHLTDVLFPDRCVACMDTMPARRPALTCDACWSALPRNGTHCDICADPLASSGICGRCQLKPLVTGCTVAPLLHQGVPRRWVHRLKFAHGAREGRALASMLIASVRARYRHDTLPTLLLPMPLARLREIQRGYNQAAYLAQVVGAAVDIEVQYRTWHRRHTPAQQSLKQSARRRLSPRIFARRRDIEHAHVAIVDDVLTTGRSVEALAQSLSDAGVTRIDVWCATRAPSTIIDQPAMLQ